MMRLFSLTLLAAIVCTQNVQAQDAAPAAPNGEIQAVLKTSVIPEDGTVATETTVNLADAAIPSDTPPQDAVLDGTTDIEKEIGAQLSFLKPTVDVNLMPSLFYSVWEHDLIVDARRGLKTRAPGSDDGVDVVGPRELALGGIVYNSSKDWTIWLNGLRITPTALPQEIMDLKVFKTYIELEWFDASTNSIYPVRLRPLQRFNIDTRMFLPG